MGRSNIGSEPHPLSCPKKNDHSPYDFSQQSTKEDLHEACHDPKRDREYHADHQSGNPSGHGGQKQKNMEKGPLNSFRYNRSLHRIDIEMESQKHEHQTDEGGDPKKRIFEKISQCGYGFH